MSCFSVVTVISACSFDQAKSADHVLSEALCVQCINVLCVQNVQAMYYKFQKKKNYNPYLATGKKSKVMPQFHYLSPFIGHGRGSLQPSLKT